MTTQFELLSKQATDLCTLILSQQQSTTTTSTLTSSSNKLELTTTTDSNPITPPPTILEIRSDFIQLVTHLGKECTSLTLACKPPLTLLAVEGTLKNLINLLNKFNICVGFCPSVGALSKEIRWIAYELTEAIQRLIESSLESHLAPTRQKSTSLRTVNLSLTGQVWEKVTLASTSLSCTELESRRKEWQAVLELLDDCLEEIKEMEEEPSPEEEDEGYGDSADEEDDYRQSHPLGEIERKRVKAAHLLLRLGRLLLKRLITSTAPPPPSKQSSKPSSSTSKSILPPSPSSSPTSSSSTSTLPSPNYTSPSFLLLVFPLVQSLSSTADDLAISLEPPQSLPLLLTHLNSFENAARGLSEVIQGVISGTEGEEVDGKWLGVWRDQVERAAGKLRALDNEESEVKELEGQEKGSVVEGEKEKEEEIGISS